MAPIYCSGPWQTFPPMERWIQFEDVFNRNKPSMFAKGNTGKDVGRIWNTIKECAYIGVDERVILAIIMQEIHGDVGARTTYSGSGRIATSGVIQCYRCPGYEGKHGLSQAAITDMSRKGTEHFKQNLRHYGDKRSGESIYPALREYNSDNVKSGNVNYGNLSDGRGAAPECQ
ncbi:hypothetical protein K458DRAFT_444332 [Lentithecium fluviatile CBS 122367]|uniref:Uncharacterized protein n=1 Tax=Lentithecium fluviatile CBS 122367 TaxID=1168545 RepID=A0A6G1IVX0_9PLEO|nr:hypothetical protein K458DRAFT_444332 [Lentithecium fluviatile CBS 122367]